jgi:hypothetical protein
MTKNIKENEWLEEFNQFISTEQMEPPQSISEKILSNTKKLLNPSPWLVFLKLLGIHSVFGTLSLAICNQFGLNPFNTHLSLSEYFMTFGHSFCMLLCGVIFVSFSIIGAWMIFSRDEFNVLKNNYMTQVCSISFLSLATFVAFGADVSLSLAVLWLIGALVGGAIPTWTLAHKTIRFA